jgi:hypothetical protein
MSAQPCIPLKLMLTEVEFGVLTEVGEENTFVAGGSAQDHPRRICGTAGPIIRISTSNSPCFGIGSSGD